jgi:hypothetical protein
MTAAEAQKVRGVFSSNFGKTSFVAAPVDLAVLKNFPHINRGSTPPTIELQRAEGHWSGGGNTYIVTLSIEGKEQQLTGEIRNDRLALTSQELNLGFVRED